MSESIATVIEWNDRIATDWGFDLPAAGVAAAEASLAVTVARHIGWRGKSVIRSYNGKPYLVLYGRPGERPRLPGTRYLPTNPKVIAAGLGPVANARHLVRVNMVGIFLYSAIDITRFLIDDRATWQELLGQVGVDIGKVLAASGIGYGTATLAVAAASLATVVLTPVAVVVIGAVAGVAAGIGLSYIDRRLAITETVKANLAEVDSLLDLLPSIPASFTPRQQQKLIARARGRRNRP